MRWRRSGWSMAATFAWRSGRGHVERLPELAQSMVRVKASVIVAFTAPAIRAAQQASTIPIVANGELVALRADPQLGQARRQHHRGQHA
jgi:hypothetical protein